MYIWVSREVQGKEDDCLLCLLWIILPCFFGVCIREYAVPFVPSPPGSCLRLCGRQDHALLLRPRPRPLRSPPPSPSRALGLLGLILRKASILPQQQGQRHRDNKMLPLFFTPVVLGYFVARDSCQ
ncbi:uncharacterized protein LOC119591230 [Penaeus monodon]|uniref:uncharacterized protein LOC119591230 n=1 Tax=Penaeus monodon TaxID=6687 RepID=UPI0018A7347F|nr:uncharacterized protein LOC119591230 [Penaeus monodon]